MGILLGVSGFRVSALNHVCPSICPFVRPISYWLEDCPTCDWTEGRKGGAFSLSLINTNEEVSSFSHTHTFKSGGEFSLTHKLKSRGELTHTHTEIRRWVLTHSHTQIRRWFLTHSNEKVSSQSLTHPRSFTCVNGFTYLHLYKKMGVHRFLIR